MNKKIFFTLSVVLLSFNVSHSRDEYSQIHDLITTWQITRARSLMDELQEVPPFLKGLYEFYIGNYKAALNYFEESPRETEEWITRCRDTLETAKNFQEMNTGYFTIRYTGKDEVLALYLKDMMDKIALRGYEKFGWKPDDRRIILEIYPDRASFKKASTLTDEQIKVSGAIGICKFNRLMVASPRVLLFGYNWPRTITHEYIHLIVGKITGLKNMPLWFNEGLAKLYENLGGIYGEQYSTELSPVAKNYLIEARRRESNWVNLDKMKYGMPTLDSSEEVKLGFAQVHSMTEYIRKNYGKDSIKKLLYLLKEKKEKEAFLTGIGTTPEEIFEKWKEYIKDAPIDYTPGATLSGYLFDDEKEDTVGRYIAYRAETDISLARRFEQRGNYNLSIRKYKDALSKDEGNHIIYNRLGRVKVKAGKLKEAKESLLKAIHRNPDYPPPYLHLGEIFFNKGKYKWGENKLLQYIYISPFNPGSHELLVKIYGQTGEKEKRKRERKILKILDED